MISGYAWSEEPISGLPAAEDISSPNPLAELLSDPKVQLAFMLRGQPFDPDLGERRSVYLSGSGYATLDDGAGEAEGIPDNTPFPASLVSAYKVTVNLVSGGSWQASAVPGYGAVVAANPDGRHDDLLKLHWGLAPIEVWIGRRQWIGPSFRTLGRVFHGLVEFFTWNTSQISFSIRDLRQQFEEEVNPEAYLGFGTAVRFRAEGDRLTIPYGAWTRPTDADENPVLAVEFMVEAVAAGLLATQGGSDGWAMWLHGDGSLGLYDRDETNFVRSDPGVVSLGVPTRVGFYGDAEGLKIRVDGKTVASNAFPYGGPVVTEDVVIGGPPL